MRPDIIKLKPRDISDVLKFIPGATVTFGDKDTYSLKLRGTDGKRIALLVDGVPVYEPYFSTFDLKTISAGGIDTIQVTKGPSSVLYGPNTLGGLVNVITKRPSGRPELSLTGSYGDKGTTGLGADGSYSWKDFSLAASALYQASDGFYFPDPETGKTLRANGDFERLNLSGKLYFTPSDKTEIMVSGGTYQSEYGMPAGPLHPARPVLAFPPVGPLDPERRRIHVARRRRRSALPRLHGQLLQHARLVQRRSHDRPRFFEHLR